MGSGHKTISGRLLPPTPDVHSGEWWQSLSQEVAGEDRHLGFPLISVVTHTCEYSPTLYKQMGVNNHVNDGQL